MRIEFRRKVAVTVLALGALGASAFGIQRNVLASAPAKHQHANVTIHFFLNWLPNVEFAGLWMAQHFGWWQKAGISMTYTGWSPSVVPETDVPTHSGMQFGFQ